MGWLTKIYQNHHQDNLRVSMRKVLLIGLGIFALLYYISETELGKNLEIRTARKLQFHVRDMLGMNPPVAKNLKILMYDDNTIDYMLKNFDQSKGSVTDLNLASWAQVYDQIAKRQPKLIFTDKLFSEPDGDMKTRMAFVEKIKKISVPVGAAVFSKKVAPDLSLDREVNYKDPNYELENWSQKNEFPYSIKANEQLRVFGPHISVQNAFRFLGHIQLDGQTGESPAFLRPKTNVVIPHWSFFASSHKDTDGFNVYLDGNRLPINKEGHFIVNMIPRSTIEPNIISFKRILSDIFNKSPITEVKEGDVVLILFNHTGINDWFETAFGSMEGGILNAIITNSIITGNFIEKIDDKKTLLVLAVATGLISATFFSIKYSLALSFLSMLVFPAAGLLLFSFKGYEVSWIFPLLGFTFANGAVSYDRYRITEKRSDRIRNALSGMISEDKLEQLIRSPENLDIKPSSREVTIMFVDMVGFSIVAERTDPEEAFSLLKASIQDITRIIHNYGGVIDRTLGDGVLCFFGYHYDGSEILGNHASQAIDCAIHIQRHILEKNLAAHAQKRPNFPLRIGINTAKVFIGDMGDERRLDYTLIGDGVNFAQRLESSCESYHVLVSEHSKKRYEQVEADAIDIYEKYVLIKHHHELIKTYEINPFAKQKEDLYRAVQAHRQFAGLEREHERVPTTGHNKIQILTQFDEGFLINFSPAGFGIWLPRYIGKGVDLELRLKPSIDSRLEKELHDGGFFPLFAQVRWAKPSETGFLHGLALHNLSQERQQKLYSTLIQSSEISAKRA